MSPHIVSPDNLPPEVKAAFDKLKAETEGKTNKAHRRHVFLDGLASLFTMPLSAISELIPTARYMLKEVPFRELPGFYVIEGIRSLTWPLFMYFALFQAPLGVRLTAAALSWLMFVNRASWQWRAKEERRVLRGVQESTLTEMLEIFSDLMDQVEMAQFMVKGFTSTLASLPVVDAEIQQQLDKATKEVVSQFNSRQMKSQLALVKTLRGYAKLTGIQAKVMTHTGDPDDIKLVPGDTSDEVFDALERSILGTSDVDTIEKMVEKWTNEKEEG